MAGVNNPPLHDIPKMHRRSVRLMAYNDKYDCGISVDGGMMMEYWRSSGNFDKPSNVSNFEKEKAVLISLTVSPTGDTFAILLP